MRLVLIAVLAVACYTTPPIDYPVHPASIDGNAPVAIFGQVERSGQIRYVRGMTLTRAIAAAGGLTKLARTQWVPLTRGGRKYRILLGEILAGSAPDPELAPGDEIFIPEAPE